MWLAGAGCVGSVSPGDCTVGYTLAVSRMLCDVTTGCDASINDPGLNHVGISIAAEHTCLYACFTLQVYACYTLQVNAKSVQTRMHHAARLGCHTIMCFVNDKQF